jgi:N6-L-threonylcarbamoyladenine synthase
MLILGIETSCDETAAALAGGKNRLLSQALYSQSAHALYGGVVPEIASREHLEHLDRLVRLALRQAGVSAPDLSLIAVTNAPGLIGALIVGVAYAKTLAWGLGIPVVGIHHLEAHILTNHFNHPELTPPYASLVISGGHTLHVDIPAAGTYHILGETRDDAAGEAFDKIGKLLGLDYPAGGKIAALAETGNPAAFRFPRALRGKGETDFSFSGLKTAVLNRLRPLPPAEISSRLPDICASVQEAIVEALAEKSLRLMRTAGRDTLLLAGGVACNTRLREVVQERLRPHEKMMCPDRSLCTDNAAMVALAAAYKYPEPPPSQWELDTAATVPITSAG